jgi:hypothetical protein
VYEVGCRVALRESVERTKVLEALMGDTRSEKVKEEKKVTKGKKMCVVDPAPLVGQPSIWVSLNHSLLLPLQLLVGQFQGVVSILGLLYASPSPAASPVVRLAARCGFIFGSPPFIPSPAAPTVVRLASGCGFICWVLLDSSPSLTAPTAVRLV